MVPHPLAASEKDEPWKVLLEMPARAAWRVVMGSSSAARLPVHAALQAVLNEGGRNRKQLRRTHEAVLETHRALVQRRERERQRILHDREYKPIDQKRDEGVRSVMYGPDEALAAFYFRLFPHYAVVERVLKETQSLLGRQHWKPARVLDFGMGCGSASAAALQVFPDHIEWVHGIDPSQTMREGAKYFLDEFLKQLQQGTDGTEGKVVVRTTFSAHISAETAPGTFDLAILAHTATELPHNSATLAAAAVCWEKLRPGGIFVMIEPGTPDGFSSVRTVRNMLLDCFGTNNSSSEVDHQAAEETCHIIAPCTHNGRCPMERFQQKNKFQKTQRDADDVEDDSNDEASDGEDDEDGTQKGYCSFVQGMPGGNGSGKGEKFSYIVAQKRDSLVAELSHRFDGINLPNLLKRSRLSVAEGHNPSPDAALLKEAVDLEKRFIGSDDDQLGLEFLRGDANRESYGRIIRAPKKKKGHVLIDCCAAPGKIVRYKVSKSMSKQIPGIYSASRKSRWGGLWPDVAEFHEPF